MAEQKKGFLGQDWSWDALKSSFKDTMKDPGGLTANPLFTSGMGLLGASYDSRINPFGAALQGLQSGYQQQQSDEDRRRNQELRDKLAPLIEAQLKALQGGSGTGVPGAVPGQPAPTATEQALQMSLLPGMPGSSANVPGEPVLGGMQTPIPGLGQESNRLLQMLQLQNFGK